MATGNRTRRAAVAARAETPHALMFGGDAIVWRAALLAGLVSGAVVLFGLLLLTPLFVQASGWTPLRMIAAMPLGQSTLGLTSFAFGPFVVALVVHFALSVLYAVGISLVVARMPFGAALPVGVAIGFALYLLNFYGFTHVYPWFAVARGAPLVGLHLVFGLVAAFTYKSLARRSAAA